MTSTRMDVVALPAVVVVVLEVDYVVVADFFEK
jgi:hypothetical protein